MIRYLKQLLQLHLRSIRKPLYSPGTAIVYAQFMRRKETKQLQGSKAKQKSKKKQVEEEISWLSTDLKEKQAKELASLGYSSNKENNNKGEIDNLVRAIQGVSASSQPDQSKPSKSAKRRGKRAQKGAEREQRIKEEQSKVVSDRVIENERLEKNLEPLGLMVNEIKPDGHCLYRAVEHQLAYLSGGLSPYNFQKLREMVSVYMRTRSSDFLPFFLSENAAEGNSEDSDSVEERFENYYKEIKSTAAWGGHLELGALTHCLRKHIIVCSGSFPDVEMGKEYKYGGGLDSSILLSYHKHAFGLGEHCNSVVHDATK